MNSLQLYLKFCATFLDIPQNFCPSTVFVITQFPRHFQNAWPPRFLICLLSLLWLPFHKSTSFLVMTKFLDVILIWFNFRIGRRPGATWTWVRCCTWTESSLKRRAATEKLWDFSQMMSQHWRISTNFTTCWAKEVRRDAAPANALRPPTEQVFIFTVCELSVFKRWQATATLHRLSNTRVTAS